MRKISVSSFEKAELVKHNKKNNKTNKILYLSAKVVSRSSSSLGAFIVSVTSTSLGEESWVPHSPQNFKVSGLSV